MQDVIPIPLDPPGQRVSYAQNGEDVRLWRAFDPIPEGFYVEVGGWEPERESVSRSFYGRGWRGIVLEPAPDMAAKYAQARPRDRVIPALAGARSGIMAFYRFPETGLSTTVSEIASVHREQGRICEEVELPVISLNEVLTEAAPANIHFMLIDVEGAEAEVLAGLDLHVHRPWILVIEATLPNSTVTNHHEWEPIVLAAGYQYAAFDGLNRYYVAAEHANLGDRLAPPPNVHDRYVTAGQQDLARTTEQAKAQVRVAEQQVAALQVQAEALGDERDQLQVRLDLLHAMLIAARDARDEAHARAEALADQVAEVRLAHRTQAAELAGLRRAIEESTRASQESERARQQLTAELASLHASRSWRVTAPLRRGTAAE